MKKLFICLGMVSLLFLIGCKDNRPVVEVQLSDNVKLELVRVEAGTFMMGSPINEEGRDDDEDLHAVTLTEDFYIGKTEVTTAQWEAVMGSHDQGDDMPVRASWDRAMEFCKKLNDMGKAPKGWKFTLPTEAQWEYAARGGHKNRGYHKYSGSDDLDAVAWTERNSRGKSHPVATKQANELGVYDMSGNVEEWCLDWYGSYKGDAQDPMRGPAPNLWGSGHDGPVLRGGNARILGFTMSSRSAARSFCKYYKGAGGIRLALVPVPFKDRIGQLLRW